LLGGACLLLGACSVGPSYQRPDVAPPAAFQQAPDPAAVPVPVVLDSHWWTLFGDDDLNRLAGEVLAANQDVKAALARVDEARALTRSARGDFFPSLDLAPSVRRARTPGATSTTTTTYNLPVDLSYELDVWGRLRRQYETQANLERASAADFAVVQQTALADLAQGYFALRLYDRQLDILERALDLFRKQLELTQGKQKAGLALQTDVLEAQNQVDGAENQLLEVQRSRVKQEHALALLTGHPPAGFSLARRIVTVPAPEVPAGLPASLLSRRPDVAEAEYRLIAANAQVGVAQANFYPTLSLTGSAGFESLDLGSLTNWENRVWSVAPGLTLPLFSGGKLTAALAGAKASYEELAAKYRSTVLGAYRDVEDELSDLHLLAREEKAFDQSLASARENFRLTELQYKQGLTSYLEVITANQTLLTTELDSARAWNDRHAASVLLIKALGGGWDPAAPVGK
jgi:multidrug efflux system outer membrane protein